ncbi:MAG: hypothetical protein WC709_05960 [Thermoleophilia bacterium]
MADLKEKFSRKQWKHCCGKGCKNCEIAQTYTAEHGRKKGLEKLNDDRAEMTKRKKKAAAGGKKAGGKKAGGKKAGGKKKATVKK